MITINRVENRINVIIDTGIGWTVTFLNERDKPLDAELLRLQIVNKLSDELENIRREAYLQGWDDKRKRIAKRTWFSRTFKKY